MRGLLMALGLLIAGPTWAAHAYAQFGDIKYPPNFQHWDYVNPDAPKGGEIRMVPPTTPTNFDKFNPFTLKGFEPPSEGDLLFDTLLTGNSEEPTTAYGLLADDVTVAPDRLSATFHLNPKAHFQNGQPVLAADVVHSFRTLVSYKAAPQYRAYFAAVKSATQVDERTVRFDFAQPNPELPLIVGGLPVFGRDWGKGKPFDEVVTELPISSGPYKLADTHMGRDVTYLRDPNYWAKDLPVRKGMYNFDRITFRIYLDDTARFEGFKAGEFDFMREFISRNWARQYYGKPFRTGEVAKRAFPNHNPGDFQGYIINLRKPKFQDIRVREALNYAFDFEWMDRNLFYGLYRRVQDYFPNSEFHAEGLPKPDELALLEPLRAKLRPEVFGPMPIQPTTNPPHSLRENLRVAQRLLKEAGWTYRDGALRNAKGEPFTIEYLNDQPSGTRLVAPFEMALAKLGIRLIYRVVDPSLAKERMDHFDFEFTTVRLVANLAPGSDLIDRWGSKAAHTTGSANLWGIADPAVDALLQKVLSAQTRPALDAAMRALDRVLTTGWYSIPQWYSSEFLVGYRPKRFVLPKVIPPYYDVHNWAMSTWWASPENH